MTGGMEDGLRVCTFNIRLKTPRDEEDAWAKRKDHVVSAIRSIEPDVIGLQEPLPEQYDFLRETLTEYDWYGVGRQGEDSGEFCPVGWRHARFETVERETRWLSETPNESASVGWDATFPRIATRVRLRDREDHDRTFQLWNVHLSHEGEQARVEAADLLVEWLEGKASSILIGDFNSSPGSDPHRKLAQTLEDTHAVATQTVGPPGTFHDFDGTPEERIDHIFVTSDIEVASVETVTREEAGRYPSDHFPVVADLRLTAED